MRTHVVATAGHVDHGKSTLVRALTGMEPDRYAEERRRGMTLDLGFVWMRLGGPDEPRSIAFVDVPGHERFVATMLAGVGPVPAVLLAVAADEGWMPQSAEHLDALDALGVTRGLLAVTRTDLADPAPAIAEARTQLANLLTYMDGKVKAEELVSQLLQDPTLMQSLLAAPKAGAAEEGASSAGAAAPDEEPSRG